jgi:dinuclear metal center YbgI/SA1388 family protein
VNIRELLYEIDKIVPFNLSEEWDNTGLIIGNNDMPVSKVSLVLDVTPEIIDRAADSKCDVVISHHPTIFSPVSSIDTSTLTGATIKNALKHDIAIISLHTNWDKSGLNNTLALALSLNNIRTLQPKIKEEDRIGVVGELWQKKDPDSFLRMVKDAWNLSHVICHEPKNKKAIQKVGICGGAGGEFWLDALHENCDAFITSEVKRHHRLAANYKGMYIIATDHYEMENYSLSNLKQLLENNIEINIEILNPTEIIKVLTQ